MKTLPYRDYLASESAEPRPVRTAARGAIATSLALLGLCCLGGFEEARAEAITYSPIQAAARPFRLNIDDRVQVAGSDAASAKFLTQELPAMQQLINVNLHETAAISNRGAAGGLVALKPEALKLTTAADLRVYFVGEGAGYHNSLGYNTGAGGVQGGNPLLIFPDASAPNSYLSSGGNRRTASEPLMPGDFVDLGNFGKGTNIDFFLIANGANGGTNVFSTDSTLNPDHITHAVTFAHVSSPYLLVSFEDLYGGGDKDYNDAIFAVYFGERNMQTLMQSAPLHGVPAPEPALIWLLVAGCGCGLVYARRHAPRQVPQPALAVC